ncbi:nucleotide-diphospho-sugar transferase [Fennellomyces sp. T-0311]|nr:nucleotide-diphospho-sugar transferase [Fennellomyces sp. T-0311]
MSKRRQTLGIQIASALAIFIFVAYFFLPITPSVDPPTHVQKPASDFHGDKLDIHDFQLVKTPKNRVKAAFVILARNSDLNGVRFAIRQVEDRFNRKFNYPYVFLNEQDFSNEFKTLTSTLTKANTFYGKIDPSMWSYPEHINQTHAAECRKDMADRKIIYGGSEPYRHMCRFQSGFFFRHPLLDDFEYYWRVEPDVQYFCDIDYDVFQMMKDNQYKYGWTVSLTEYMSTIPTLWKTVNEFIKEHPQYVVTGEESIMPWLTDDNFLSYNGCHFWSNFEIGSLDFLRSKKYIEYFEHLDKAGGFFYERWGDAPVHSIAVAMMLKKSEVHFFNDIGYKHNPLMHCPTEAYLQSSCHCNAGENFDWTGWSCATRWKQRIDDSFVWNEEKYRNQTAAYRLRA